MFKRFAESPFRAALTDTPVVLIVGARQVGKSTLVRHVLGTTPGATYTTLDDLTALDAARADPVAFVDRGPGLLAIDEVQRAPDLLLAIKASVDRDRQPGRFVLTGSTNILALPTISDALTGRIDVIRLRPLAQAEIVGHDRSFVDAVFGATLPSAADAMDRRDLVQRIIAGGFPEALERADARRAAWFESYVTTIVQRDVRDLSRIEDLTALPRLLRLLASRVGGLLNVSDVSRALGLPITTVNRYLAILTTIMLVEPIPAWSANLGRRLVRAPKVGLVDPGLTAALQGLSAARLQEDPDRLGPLLEAFVTEELRRDAGWSAIGPTTSHYRDQAGAEVDVVLEARDGRVVGIEVKSSSAVTSHDTRGLRALQSATDDRFVQGIVLYTGSEVVPLGDRLVAAPINSLWSA